MKSSCSPAARAEIQAISIVTALCLVGDSFLYVALPLHWQEAGLGSLYEVGIILAVNRLVRIPLNPIITLFYGRFSCWTGILLATLLAIASTAGYGLGQGLVFWIGMRFLWGLSWTLLRLGTLYSIIRVSTPSTLGYLTGMNNGLYRLGSLCGMLLGGILSDTFGLQITALFFACVSFCAPFVVLKKVPRTETHVAGRRPAPAANSWRSVFACNPGAVLWILMTAFIVAMTYQGLTASTISMLLDAHSEEKLVLAGLTLSAATISGGLQSLRWVWEPFLAPIFGNLSDGRLGRCRLTAIALCVSALTLFAGSWDLSLMSLCIVLLLVLLSATMVTTASDALGNDAAMLSQNSRLYLSAFALFTDLGAAAGPLVAYLIIALADVSVAWVIISALLLLFSIYWWLHPTLPKAQDAA